MMPFVAGKCARGMGENYAITLAARETKANVN